MDDWPASDNLDNGREWTSRLILVPRIGLRVSAHGLQRKLILPGRYWVRRSRTFGRKIYRAH